MFLMTINSFAFNFYAFLMIFDFWSQNLRFSASSESVTKRGILRPKFEYFDNFLR